MNVPTLPHVRLRDAGKRDIRTQFGAVCWRRRKRKVELLLITSRRTRRWLIPKGWPMDGMTPAETAAQEALEEAGVIGRPDPRCLGIYLYEKDLGVGRSIPCAVALYPLQIHEQLAAWPEQEERVRRWRNPKEAAKLVLEPDLAQILRDFTPPA